MKEIFEIKEIFKAKRVRIYQAWLDSEEHTKMTGGVAECSAKVDGYFSAWDGYIAGKNVQLIENKKIVQKWRTTEFAANDEDSLVTIVLKEVENGTALVLTHSNIPDGQTQYKQGWKDHYFEPMKIYFNNL